MGWIYESVSVSGNFHQAVEYLQKIVAPKHPEHDIVAMDYSGGSTVIVWRYPETASSHMPELDQEARKQLDLMVSWLVAAGGMRRDMWNELTSVQQEIIRLALYRIGLHLHVLADVVKATPDPRD